MSPTPLPRVTALALSLLSCMHLLSPTPVHAAVPTKVSHVIHIVADGLRADSLLTSGHPAFDYLLQSGACTLNARHDDLSSQTLPNHIGMFTGLPISDHGYAEDKDHGANTTLVDSATGQPFQSIFDLVDSSRSSGTTNGRTAIFTSKSKFQLFDRSFPVSSYFENKKSKAVVRRYVNEMSNKHFAYSYLHVVDPDLNGHRYDGAASPQYQTGVALASYRLGEVLDMIATNDILRDDTAIILTADHGFSDHGNHADGDDPNVYHIPFCAWGPGVAAHGNLYEMNRGNGSGLENPGDRKARGEKVIRNAYAAQLSADFLGIHPEGGALADQYMAVGDGSSTDGAAMSWTEWKAAHQSDYDWTEPTDEEIDVLEESTDEGGSNDDTPAATAPEIVSVPIPIEEMSKEEKKEEDDVPVPMDVEEAIGTEEIPVPMDAEESINTEEVPVPIDVEESINTDDVPVPIDVKEAIDTEEVPVLIDMEADKEEEEEKEEETSMVLVPPNEVSEDVSKANVLPEDDEPVETAAPDESKADADFVRKVDAETEITEESADTLVPEQSELWDSMSESQDIEDEEGSGPGISAFIEETTYDNVPRQNTGLTGVEVGLVAASAVALLALGIAVYIYATASKAKAEAEVVEDDLEKADGRTKLDETRVSISSGGSDDGTDNLFSGYASSSTFDEESCIDVGRSSSTRSRSFNRSSSSAMHKSRSFSLDEAAGAHIQAIEAGAWPDDVVPLEAVEVEAVEVTVTETKTVWHVVDLER